MGHGDRRTAESKGYEGGSFVSFDPTLGSLPGRTPSLVLPELRVLVETARIRRKGPPPSVPSQGPQNRTNGA